MQYTISTLTTLRFVSDHIQNKRCIFENKYISGWKCFLRLYRYSCPLYYKNASALNLLKIKEILHAEIYLFRTFNLIIDISQAFIVITLYFLFYDLVALVKHRFRASSLRLMIDNLLRFRSFSRSRKCLVLLPITDHSTGFWRRAPLFS